MLTPAFYIQEEFGDTKGVLRIRKSKNRLHKGQMKKNKKRQTTIYNTIHIKLMIESYEV